MNAHRWWFPVWPSKWWIGNLRRCLWRRTCYDGRPQGSQWPARACWQVNNNNNNNDKPALSSQVWLSRQLSWFSARPRHSKVSACLRNIRFFRRRRGRCLKSTSCPILGFFKGFAGRWRLRYQAWPVIQHRCLLATKQEMDKWRKPSQESIIPKSSKQSS